MAAMGAWRPLRGVDARAPIPYAAPAMAFVRPALVGSALVLSLAAPADACLSCSCGGSGASADLGAAGGAASFFSMGARWLVQQGVSLRTVTGSFNERGAVSPVPVDGSLLTAQGTLALTHFPAPGVGLGLQLPVLGHRLERASWGMFGSVEATDAAARLGGGLGDPVVQGSVQLAEWGGAGLAAWGSASLPLGRASGEAEGLTGLGFGTGALGLVALSQWEGWELTLSGGHQRPWGQTPAANPFALGPTWLYQAHLGRQLGDAWRLGLGVNGWVGAWVPPAGAGAGQETAKPKLVASAQWAHSPLAGLRLALGADPEGLGARNAMRDVTLYVIGYQYMR
ncbi:MAG: hypothetical protein VKQ33_00975 [Candidatus Sericytochromatia bacterium]|nr:hypothetical protein [Candidatus Sericytochromatia bacterium]